MREEKITFDKIFAEFCTKFPNMSKRVFRWRPSGYLEIWVSLTDGMEMTYSYFLKTVKILKTG